MIGRAIGRTALGRVLAGRASAQAAKTAASGKNANASKSPPTPSSADENGAPSTLSRRVMTALEDWGAPFATDGPPEPPRGLWRFFFWSYRGVGLPIVVLTVLSFLVGILEIAVLAAIGALVDRAEAGEPGAFFVENGWFLAGLVGLVLILRPLLITASACLGAMVIGPNLAPSIIWRLHRHLLGQPMRYFEDDFAGRLTQKEMQAANAVDVVTIELINVAGLMAGFLVGMAAVLGAADWRLGLCVLIWLGAYVVFLRWILPKIRAAAIRRAEATARVSGQLVDAVSNIKTVKLFAAPGVEEEATVESLARLRRARLDMGTQVTIARGVLNLMNGVAMAALTGLALALWSFGAASIGIVAVAGMMIVRLTHMSGWIAFTLLGIFREIGTLEDALGTLANPHALKDRSRPLSLGAPALGAAGARSRVAFEDVSFAYARPEGAASPPIPALRGVSLTLEPGEKVGLVGPSGAGKSTLIALLARLYDVTDGRITLGGADIRALPQAELRAHMGMVTQEAALFNRSARDNIRYGRADADDQTIAEAARRARADAFIRSLRDTKGREGYDAHIGERGVKLSGGQRQRIALARAFLKDAPILILDEATSALDSGVEAEILDAMSELMRGKSVLAIAHRLSTLAEMDRIVVLNHGRIVEEGAHDVLLRRGGLYATLWARQSGGMLPLAAAAE